MLPMQKCLGAVEASVENVYVGRGVESIATLTDSNKVLAALHSGDILLVDAISLEITKRLIGHTKTVRSIAVSGDGLWMVSGSSDGTVRRWNVKTGSIIGPPLVDHKNTVTSVALSESGEVIVSGAWNGQIRVWSMKS